MLSVSEAALIRHFKPRAVDATGLQHSFARVARQAGWDESRLPRLVIVQGLLPYALVARGFSGRGSILLSQGLLASLNETDLREILTACTLKSRERWLPWRSFFSICWLGLARVTPRPSSVLGAFGFTVLYPWLSLVARLAGARADERRKRLPLDLLSDGAATLYVVDPRANPVVFRG